MKRRINLLWMAALVALFTFSCSEESLEPTPQIEDQLFSGNCNNGLRQPINGPVNVNVRLTTQSDAFTGAQTRNVNFTLERGQGRVINLRNFSGFNNNLSEVTIESDINALFTYGTYSRGNGRGRRIQGNDGFVVCRTNGNQGSETFRLFESGRDASSVIIRRRD